MSKVRVAEASANLLWLLDVLLGTRLPKVLFQTGADHKSASDESSGYLPLSRDNLETQKNIYCIIKRRSLILKSDLITDVLAIKVY